METRTDPTTTPPVHWPVGRYLVTGGAGFIGSNLVASLVNAGLFVRVVDNLDTGKRENLDGLDVEAYLGPDEGDLRDFDLCTRAVDGIDYVLHEAARGSVPRSVDDPLGSNDHNVTLVLNVLKAAADAKVKRMVYAASSSAYGNTKTLPKREDMDAQPLSPYAVAKYVGELYARVFFQTYGLETVSLRYFNVFGRRQTPDGAYAAVIPIFVKHLLLGKSPLIHGDGEQSRDFTYIDNVLQANALALTAPQAALGDVFNCAYGERFTLNQLFDKIADLLGSDIRPRYGDPRPGDVRHSHADISKARQTLGYDPKVDLFEGLERAIDWYRKNL